jgi:hypothetical protein
MEDQMSRITISIAWIALLFPVSTWAADSSLLGTWKLQSYTRELTDTGRKYNLFGEHPNGYITYTSDGRMNAILTMDVRPKPVGAVPTIDQKEKLFGSMVAYAGSYTVDGSKVIHHVDISWNEAWTGTDQVRFFQLDGDTLTITTPVTKSAIDGQEGRSIVVWEKAR